VWNNNCRSVSFFRSLQPFGFSRNSPDFMKPEDSLLCSQEPTTWSYSELVEFTPDLTCYINLDMI
jgi:hypothetical protein